MLYERHEHVRVEFEVTGELVGQLIDCVAPLQENAAALIIRVVALAMTSATRKLMTVR